MPQDPTVLHKQDLSPTRVNGPFVAFHLATALHRARKSERSSTELTACLHLLFSLATRLASTRLLLACRALSRPRLYSRSHRALIKSGQAFEFLIYLSLVKRPPPRKRGRQVHRQDNRNLPRPQEPREEVSLL